METLKNMTDAKCMELIALIQMTVEDYSIENDIQLMYVVVACDSSGQTFTITNTQQAVRILDGAKDSFADAPDNIMSHH